MTEEDAKAKWCPFARVGGPMDSVARGTSYNRWPSSDGSEKAMLDESGHIKCIGSACMAWRWDDGSFFDPKRRMFVHDMGPHGVGASGGFCGLAGKP